MPPLKLPSGESKKHYDNESFWIGDKMSGSPSIRIVISEQKGVADDDYRSHVIRMIAETEERLQAGSTLHQLTDVMATFKNA